MSFEELQLAKPILKALARCGHEEPTPVQAQAIPKVLAGHDLIASAQTGTGKTAAFVLPALHRLATPDPVRKPGLRILVLTPTRELATQITDATRAYSKYLKVHSVAIYGGMPFGDQIRALAQLPDMIVATPGRLIDHIWRGRIDLSQVEMLVLDEADRMLDMGFIGDMEFISDAMPPECQTILFAATLGDETARLAAKFTRNPERVEIAPGKVTHERIEQRLHLTDGLQHKNRLLRRLCEDTSLTRAIVFSATKRDADVLARELSAEGHKAAALHADMTQSARNRTLVDMRRGKIRLLVATDVAARGLDITGISHVINFDLPRSAEDYVNRIGRTGRAGESGVAISLASRADLPYLDRIESYLGQNLAIHVIPGFEPAHPVRRGGVGQTNDGRKTGRGGRGGSRRSGGGAPTPGEVEGAAGAAGKGKPAATHQRRSPKGDGGARGASSSPGSPPRKPARKAARKAPSPGPVAMVKDRVVS
ncbi:MAG: DEAD/DEAH box helicase [Syntrophobacteraceae bacterium]|jgi:superfamily II DNA/RNA helicase|nr:DEAD/DEAH box helicase [Syntrophobacteraceae bacterium]